MAFRDSRALLAIGFVLSFACYAGLALFYLWLVHRIASNRDAPRAMRSA